MAYCSRRRLPVQRSRDLSDESADPGAPSERSSHDRRKKETTGIEVFAEANVIRGNKDRVKDKDTGE
jgi:hypothetical protein